MVKPWKVLRELVQVLTISHWCDAMKDVKTIQEFPRRRIVVDWNSCRGFEFEGPKAQGLNIFDATASWVLDEYSGTFNRKKDLWGPRILEKY